MFRVAIRVRPGASRTQVGGAVGERLQVRVQAPAVDGRATTAALVAIAEAFQVRPHAVALVHGHTSRDKVVSIDGDAATLAIRLDELLRI